MFIPLFLMSGYIGRLFREFAVTAGVALVLALIISLTLIPMICARLLRHDAEQQVKTRERMRAGLALLELSQDFGSGRSGFSIGRRHPAEPTIEGGAVVNLDGISLS
jgi:multidrug efflux pump subunit AcrB